MRPSFPPVRSWPEFDRIARDEALLAPGIAAIQGRLGLREAPRRFADGSLPVYAVGDALVLKVYPPTHVDELVREKRVLEVLDRRLPVPTPAVHAEGELEGWGYLLMDRLRGGTWAEAWPRIERRDQEALATKLGETLAALHAVDDPRLAAIHEPWSVFVERQSRNAVARQQSKGLAPLWLDQIDDFLARTPLGTPPECLLHTEVMREHLLVAPAGGGWELTGLVDFEPSMRGAAEYEFGSIGAFLTSGDAGLLRRILLAYGYAPSALDDLSMQAALASARRTRVRLCSERARRRARRALPRVHDPTSLQ